MISALLALTLFTSSTYADTRAQDEYEYSKAQEYRLDATRYGTSRPSLVLEKSDRNRICQKVANSGPFTHFKYTCYSVDEVGTTARDAYEREDALELDVKFWTVEGGAILTTGIRQKNRKDGFCRVSDLQAARPYYLCYSVSR